MISNVLFDSEKEEPEQKCKGKEATTHTQKQASSKGKEASNEPADKRKTDMMLGVSGRSFIDYIY